MAGSLQKSLGNGKIFTADDGWSLITKDGALSAQYEHTVVITEGAPILITQAEGVDW
ncbi:MAG: hypothetical protein HC840_30220 [Leptolyngbyaceae cyanobacterium RM2_2_4]|nr:hypothetical protein [Leptolyngbyaceae cyanobacterium RM2_2_4]